MIPDQPTAPELEVTPADGVPVAADRLPIASARHTWAVLGAEVRRMRGWTAAAFLVVLAGSAAGLVAPWALGRLVDRIAGEAGGSDTAAITEAVVLVAGAAVVGGVCTGLGAWLVGRVGETVLARLRERVVDRVLGLEAEKAERVRGGDLLSRVGDDVSAATTALTATGPELVTALFTVALTGVGLFALDWRLGLAGLVALPAYVLALRWYLPRSGPYYARERAATGERSHALLGALQGRAAVRSYRLEDLHLDRIDRRSRATRDLAVEVFGLYTRFASRINTAEFLGLTAVLVAGFALVRADLATVGAATAAALYFHRLFNPVGMLLMQFDELQSAGASLARLTAVAELPPLPDEDTGAVPADATLTIDTLSHRYDAGPLVLEDVTLHLAPGERTALVGASGAGKTTLAGLAAGVLRPAAGTVRLGGVPLGELGEHAVRSRIALVSQEVHVFAGPLADDVRLAKADAGDDEVERALKTVGALGWVRALPDGAATVVGEGGHELTAVQAQQLALARLVLADPAVAILDEATAEAGSAGARELEQAAIAATSGRTCLIVAHRLTQAAAADRVVVLDRGRVAESGTHDDLLAADGRYAALWRGWLGERDGVLHEVPADSGA